jgi:hypothetical protein
MSPALSLVSLAMSQASPARLEVVGLRQRAHEAVHSEDVRLRWADAQADSGRKEFLGRFKRAPVAPTILQKPGVVGTVPCRPEGSANGIRNPTAEVSWGMLASLGMFDRPYMGGLRGGLN